MEKRDYNNSLNVGGTVEEVFAKIGSVTEWWGADVQGDSKNVGDAFTIRFGETRATFKITEVIANERIVWHVSDCHLPWLVDKEERTGTSVVWDIEAMNGSTRINFTHIGLVPEKECFDNCKDGWNFYIEKSLFKLLTENHGLPDHRRTHRSK